MTDNASTPLAVLILGLGNSGLAMARWCARAGMAVSVADTRENPPQLQTLRTQLPSVRFVSAGLDAALLQQLDAQLVTRAPASPRNRSRA